MSAEFEEEVVLYRTSGRIQKNNKMVVIALAIGKEMRTG